MTTTLALRQPAPVDLAGYRLGQPQRAGALTMVPLFGPAYPGISSPAHVKLARVVGYGKCLMTNSGDGVAIMPLHIGYIQDAAQNHALCRSAFLAPGQELLFADACCVQQSQGGYISDRAHGLFVLPVELRAAALDLRGVENYSKLWPAIARLNASYGLPERGHLEQVLTRKHVVLTQYQSRLELLPEQLGALFFIADRLAGIEIAPDPRYFAEMWVALACFAYGPAAWHAPTVSDEVEPYDVSTLDGLRSALAQDRRVVAEQANRWLVEAPWQATDIEETERYLDLRLSIVHGDTVAGQIVTDGKRLIYASLFSRHIAA
jgi:hypothetical protein